MKLVVSVVEEIVVQLVVCDVDVVLLVVCDFEVVVFVVVVRVDTVLDDVDVLVTGVVVCVKLDLVELLIVRVVAVMLVVIVIDDVKDKHCDISSCKEPISVTKSRNS